LAFDISFETFYQFLDSNSNSSIKRGSTRNYILNYYIILQYYILQLVLAGEQVSPAPFHAG